MFERFALPILSFLRFGMQVFSFDSWSLHPDSLEYLGLWEMLNNPNFKGVEFDPLLRDAGSNSFTMSPSRWIEITNAIGLISKYLT